MEIYFNSKSHALKHLFDNFCCRNMACLLFGTVLLIDLLSMKHAVHDLGLTTCVSNVVGN